MGETVNRPAQPGDLEEVALRDGTSAYGLVARLNRWITAGAFLGALGLGLVMAYGGLAREQVFALMDWHKLLGVTVLFYGLWRIAWRAVEGFPEPAAQMPRWQEWMSKAVHLGLLAAIVAMPLSGVLMTVAGGRALGVWGVTLLPSPGEIVWLDAAASTVHAYAPWVVLGLLAAHIGAALKHHFLDRDATLARMITTRTIPAPR